MDAIPNTQPELQPVTAGMPLNGPQAVEQSVRRPRVVAPLWHTVIMLTILLAPGSFWLPLGRLMSARDRAGFRIPFYAWLLAFQWIVFLILLSGLMLRKTRVRDLIGVHWHSWQDFFRDTKLGIKVMLLNILAAVLMVMLSHRGTPHPIICSLTSWQACWASFRLPAPRDSRKKSCAATIYNGN
jgi:hypothetical protein